MTETSSTPRPVTVTACFEAAARRVPTAIAISQDGQTLEFRALDRLALAIAQQLPARGPDGGGRVALLIEDRAAAIAAMLGVLKAGHAFVPLDVTDPMARIQFMLEDCEPVAVVTDETNQDRAAERLPESVARVNVNRLVPPAAGHPLPVVAPDDLAYIYYTSGSTGDPKGVCHTHRKVAYETRNYIETLQVTATDRLSLLFSLSFGASILDIFPALFAGATVCAYDMRRDGIPRMADWVARERISILHIGPTAARQLAKSIPPGRILDTMRAMVLGGEALYGDDIELLRRHAPPGARIVNNFAATEVGVIAQHVLEPDQVAPSRIPAGRCVAGTEVGIVRPDGSAAKPGEEGELIVCGPAVSPGYWQRPELNAAVFSEHPRHPGTRCYRGGDLARLDADGTLHFIGRRGNRIKLRGYSVELAEIEAALRRCAGVREACVTATEPDDGREADRLVAHVVTDPALEASPMHLRRELLQHVPQYMIPATFLFQDSLPLTASGKIDRLALSRLAAAPAARPVPFEEPAEDIERGVAAIYERILKVSPVGRNDDFFLSGGDSMSVIELQIELANSLDCDFTLAQLFEDASVAGVARIVRQLAARGPGRERIMPVIVPLRAEGRGPVLFLVHGRQGLAPVSPKFLELAGEDQALYVFQARGLDGIQNPNRSIEAMAADYVAAAREIQPRGPYMLAGLCAGGYVTLEMARALVAAGEEVLPLLLIDPPTPRFSTEQSAAQLRLFEETVRHLARMNRVQNPLTHTDRREAATRVVKCMESALLKYRPTPYPGPVFLMASRQRLGPTEWGDGAMRASCFSGELHCIEVGLVHSEALDVHSSAFVDGFTGALRQIRAAATRSDE